MPEPKSQDLLTNSLANQAVHSHIGIRIMIGTKDVGSGRIQSFNADHDFGLQPVHGVGDYLPAEQVPTRFDGTITIDAFRIRTKDLVKLGIAALGLEALKMPIWDFVLFDKIDQKAYRVYENCSIGRYSERIQEGAIAGENATIKFNNVRPASS